MKAIELTGYEGIDSLRVVDVPIPEVGAPECLIEVKATGLNFAELELAYGRYKIPKEPPFIMGFEAAGIVREVGKDVKNVRVGDRVATIVSSGGFAEFATALAELVIPIPDDVSFADAVTIPIQGVTGYLLVKEVARVQPSESVLIQAAAGGVGSYLVQLAKLAGAQPVIALVGSEEKASFVEQLGADVVISSSSPGWADEVLVKTNGRGVDVVFESASGKLRNQSYGLLAPAGRVIIYGAKNVNDRLSAKQIQQLIYKNQTIIGFNIPSFDSKRIAAAVPQLMHLIRAGRLKLFALSRFPLHRVRDAFKALASRRTIGKIVLVPNLLDDFGS